MPERKITDRIAAGETLLLDGGTGSELQRRGVVKLNNVHAVAVEPSQANLLVPNKVVTCPFVVRAIQAQLNQQGVVLRESA